jgi:hypothetical protein
MLTKQPDPKVVKCPICGRMVGTYTTSSDPRERLQWHDREDAPRTVACPGNRMLLSDVR